MSEGITIALISFAGAVLGALITGFVSIIVAGMKGKGESKNESQSSMSCAIIGLVASLGAVGGLVLGALFGVLLLQKTISGTNSAEPPMSYQSTFTPTQSPSNPNNIMSDTKLLGEWLYQQSRAPMPSPAGANQVIFAHGDINNTGTCHVREFGTGETVQGLGLGSFKLWLITGTAEYIKDVETQLQNGAAAHAGTDCPYIP